MEQNVTNRRVRVNLSQTAKGLVQFDITCEFESADETLAEIKSTVLKTQNLIKELGLKAVGEE